MTACRNDESLYLDVIDAVLHLGRLGTGQLESLKNLLEQGSSVWTLSPDARSLQRRVEATAEDAFDLTIDPLDVASEELKQAWGRAYTRDADASDAWDHAIKAVEAALAPVVVPRQHKPQLGHVLGELRKTALWQLELPGLEGSHSVEPVVAMLELLWPNPDRHGSSHERRIPTLEEAQAVVHLAITVVQWARLNLIRRAPNAS
ncbi:MAG: hypothetical protein M3198_02840 [Actinomycetota bacterium]|nr:hypothetical protein [Actinomycetota bacterium]